MSNTNNPQLENGYIRIANELYQALYKADLSASELRITLFIIYQTFGYNKKSRALSASYISNGTKIPCSTVQKALDKLIKMNVVVFKNNSSHNIRVLQINKYYSKWLSKNGISKTDNVSKNGYPKLAIQNRIVTYAENGETDMPKTDNKTRQNKTRQIKQDRVVVGQPPTFEKIFEYCNEKNYTFDCEKFYKTYSATNWMSHGSKITDWKALADVWQLTEHGKVKDDESETDVWGNPIKPKWEE